MFDAIAGGDRYSGMLGVIQAQPTANVSSEMRPKKRLWTEARRQMGPLMTRAGQWLYQIAMTEVSQVTGRLTFGYRNCRPALKRYVYALAS
jgi:hypothetical protein